MFTKINPQKSQKSSIDSLNTWKSMKKSYKVVIYAQYPGDQTMKSKPQISLLLWIDLRQQTQGSRCLHKLYRYQSQYLSEATVFQMQTSNWSKIRRLSLVVIKKQWFLDKKPFFNWDSNQVMRITDKITLKFYLLIFVTFN